MATAQRVAQTTGAERVNDVSAFRSRKLERDTTPLVVPEIVLLPVPGDGSGTLTSTFVATRMPAASVPSASTRTPTARSLARPSSKLAPLAFTRWPATVGW